jgi:beta-mannosidase
VESISLAGTWRATENLGLQSRAGQPGYDDTGWTAVPVPGHWQQAASLARFAGRLLYRRAFAWNGDPPGAGEVCRLRFDGLFYYAKVWFNGSFVGEHEGYFAPESYEVTRLVRPGENVVMVELDCPAEDRTEKRMLTGVLTDWHLKDPSALPGGIWRDVLIDRYRLLVPERFEIQPAVERLPRAPLAPDEFEQLVASGAVDPPIAADAGPPLASVSFALEFTSLESGVVNWSAVVAPETFAGQPVTLAGTLPVRRGWNRLGSAVSVPDPRLWWTWDHGRPDLYRFTLEMRHENGPPLRIERLIGLRRIELRNWQLYLNGRRIFVRGTNYGPPDIYLARVSPAQYREDLDLVRGANLNMIRVHAHVDRPELYEEASRQGLLIWQDFPLQWTYSRAVLPEARRQAEQMVRLLGQWPAVALWCCHNEPSQSGPPDGGGAVGAARSLLSAALRAWNKNTLAPAVAAAVRKADRSRPIISHSGDFGFLWGGTDTHHYWGWYRGRIEDLDRVLRLFPHTARFVTEYGAQAFPAPETARAIVRGEWPQINWGELAQRYLLQREVLERHVPASLAPTLEHYVAATQAYQATLIKHYAEAVRRLKYRPCGGALQYLFADCSPGISFAVVDVRRRPKAAYEALRRAMNPLYICTDPLRPAYPLGGAVDLKVYLINDRYRPVRGRWSWQIVRDGEVLGERAEPAYIPPDGLVVIAGGVHFALGGELGPGAAELVLRLEPEAEEPVENRYLLAISARVR